MMPLPITATVEQEGGTVIAKLQAHVNGGSIGRNADVFQCGGSGEALRGLWGRAGSELAARATEEVAEIGCPVAMLAADDSGPPRRGGPDGERGRREECD